VAGVASRGTRGGREGVGLGFFGTVIVARTRRPRILRLVMRAFGASIDLDRAGAPGWWVSRLLDTGPSPEWVLRVVARAGGGQLLSADVMDSDFAVVRLIGGGPRDGRGAFEFLLNVDSAVSYGAPVDWQAQSMAASQIVSWAGGGVQEAVEKAVRRRSVFAEDGVLRLAASFGAIPADDLSEWLFDDEERTGGT
jgi:hypothetical protein